MVVANPAAVTPDLTPWPELEAESEWTGVLIGNGASRAVWDGYNYSSLYDRALSEAVAHPLPPSAQALFETITTTNFEAVLRRLREAQTVCQALEIEAGLIADRYASIKTGLIEAVHAVHVPWNRVLEATKLAMRSALLTYRSVYSTNYDLLTYWAMMAGDGAGFKDFFWTNGTEFDPGNVEVWDKSTVVMYLHGALHIHRLKGGVTVKRPANGNLLASFGTPYRGSEIPLFISEGHGPEKLAAIRESEYLSFVYRRFRAHRGSLVVFGHGLGEQDDHLLWALRGFRRDDVPLVAISMLPDAPQNTIAQKAVLHQRLPGISLAFFDARTHPLGAAGLKIPAQP